MRKRESNYTLSPRQEQVIEAYHRLGSIEKAASELGMKYGTARTTLYNARAKLARQALQSEQERIRLAAEQSFIRRHGTGDLHEARKVAGYKPKGRWAKAR